MKFVFQIDPINTLNPDSDTSLQLIKEACRRGEAYFFTPDNLFWCDGRVQAIAQKINFMQEDYSLSDKQIVNLAEMDVIFVRQNPPYDMNYLTSTYLLDKISTQVLIINNPKAIRDFPEKLAVLDYLEFIPPTLISSCVEKAKEFAKNHEKVILKPLYSFAGNDIFCVDAQDINFSNIFHNLLHIYKAPVIVQKFIEGIIHGDKRILLVDGDPIGGFVRMPKENDIRANLVFGGEALACELTARDLEICAALKPRLKKSGLFLVGIDIIDGYLTEINVTSPTGIMLIQKFYDQKIVEKIFDKIAKSA